MPVPTWAIDGLFEVNSLVMLYGPPASYKSFMALDWILTMATGRKWLGRATTPSKVLYVLGEGKASLLKRMEVWCHYHKVTPAERALLVDNFRVTFDVPQMAMKSSVDNMLSQLNAEKYEPSVIVVDTFARSFVGLDENSQKDTGMWIESADRLRQLGYTVIFLHHTAKNTEYGLKYRGSTAIMGAMDTAMSLDRESGGASRVQLKISKQKDHDEGSPLSFSRLVVRPNGKDDEGSVILVPAPQIDERFTAEGQAVERKIMELLKDTSFVSDADRGRALSKMFPELTPKAAEQRIHRSKKETPKESVH